MIKKQKNIKEQVAEDWSSKYKAYGSDDAKAVGLETKAAADIVEYGVSTKNVKFIKALDWFILVDILLISIICMAGIYKVDENLISTGRMIAIFGTLWPVVDILSISIKIYGEYVVNISPAVHIFMNSTTASNAYRKGYTKKLVQFNPEEAEAKINELQRKLRFDISKKIVILLCIFCIAGLYLIGYLKYWDASKAGVVALFGIVAGLFITAVQHIYNYIRSR